MLVTKGTAIAATLAASVAAGGNDSQMLRIVSTTAAAHVVTFPSGKINGGTYVTATFEFVLARVVKEFPRVRLEIS